MLELITSLINYPYETINKLKNWKYYINIKHSIPLPSKKITTINLISKLYSQPYHARMVQDLWYNGTMVHYLAAKWKTSLWD